MSDMIRKGRWSSRFIWAAIVQGALAVIWTIPIVLPTVSPPVSMVMASGGAGTWFTVGYLSYITVGVIGVAVTALFYHHIEIDLNKPYSGTLNYLAWAHLILMNIGVIAATWLMMYGGYMGGSAMLPVTRGGLGQNAEYVHEHILGGLVAPIGYSITIAILGVLSGGLGYVLSYMRKAPSQTQK